MQDKKEFIELIKQNEGLIYKVTKVYATNEDEGKDLYQEIVYQLWKSFPSFRQEAKISTWMYRIALNTAIAWLNKEKRKGHYIAVDEQLLNKPVITDTVAEERAAALYAVIQQLDTIEKGIILLYLEGKTYDEIAAITGFSATNVGTRLGRIRQKLKTQLNK